MEDRQQPALQYRFEIDQHVAATDQVQVRKGRVLGHVMLGKNAGVADGLRYSPAAPRPGEEAGHSFGRELGESGFGVDARAGLLDRSFADVGGEDLDRNAEPPLVQELRQRNSQRIGLLATGAPRHPSPERIPGAYAGNQGRENFIPQLLEDLGLPKEGRDRDQEVLA